MYFLIYIYISDYFYCGLITAVFDIKKKDKKIVYFSNIFYKVNQR